MFIFGLGEKPKTGDGAAKREFLLSICILLMHHITPELKYQKAAGTIKLHSTNLLVWLTVKILEMHGD